MRSIRYVAQFGTQMMLTTPALAVPPAEQRGKPYCARCDSIDRVKIAPPFRPLHLRYRVETLGEALAEGIVTSHPKALE